VTGGLRGMWVFGRGWVWILLELGGDWKVVVK